MQFPQIISHLLNIEYFFGE